MVMMAGQLLGQLEPAVIIGSVHSSRRTDVDQGSDVAVGAALREPGVGSQEFRDGQWPAGVGQSLHDGATQAGVTLIKRGQTMGDLVVNFRRKHDGAWLRL